MTDVLGQMEDLKCKGCGESLEPEFDRCWNCGQQRDGDTAAHISEPQRAAPALGEAPSALTGGHALALLHLLQLLLGGVSITLCGLGLFETDVTFFLYAIGPVGVVLALRVVAAVIHRVDRLEAELRQSRADMAPPPR
jgi:hypothetical protein